MFMKIYNKEYTSILQGQLNREDVVAYDYRFKQGFDTEEEAKKCYSIIKKCAIEFLRLEGTLDFVCFKYGECYWVQIKNIKLIAIGNVYKTN